MRHRLTAFIMALLVFCPLLFCNVVLASSKEEKKLYFSEQDGKMCYDPVRMQEGKYRFMSFTSMVPGGTYHDELKIENGCPNKTYSLYLQIIPQQQSDEADLLLEKISMRVSSGGKLLYDGKATGKAYTQISTNLRETIYLGTYSFGREGKIETALGLDKDVGVELSNILSVIDWKFMVVESEEITEDDPPLTPPVPPENIPDQPIPLIPASPGTGDSSFLRTAVILAVCCVAGTALLAARAKNRKEY